MLERQIHVVVDGQFGSTGKGLLVGYLAKRIQPDTICTAWAANAGHTFIDGSGRKFIHTMLANGIVSSGVKTVLLGAGSVIDPINLEREYEECRDLLQTTRIAIHPHAAIIGQIHRDIENGNMTVIGSTKKGCGEAAIQRIRRQPHDMNVAIASDHPFIKNHVVSVEKYNQLLDQSKIVLIEGAQGYSLSMYHGFYPYTTSRDVSTAQVLADCCIPHNFGKVKVYGCFRTYPIRVANRYDESGDMVGYSGGCYPDQAEMDWNELGIEPELTTVTQLPRRIFTFSGQQYQQAIRQCGIDEVFINFANYLPTEQSVRDFCRSLNRFTKAQVRYIGIGATENDICEVDSLELSSMYISGQPNPLANFKSSLGV